MWQLRYNKTISVSFWKINQYLMYSLSSSIGVTSYFYLYLFAGCIYIEQGQGWPTCLASEPYFKYKSLGGPKNLPKKVWRAKNGIFYFIYIRTKAGVTFNNSFLDNYFDFLWQLKNGLFLGPVFVHVTGWSKN
jgi:hypothetical protein